MKKLIATIAVIATITTGTVYADTRSASVMIDGKTYGALANGSYIQDGYTMVSATALSHVIRTAVKADAGDGRLIVGGALAVELPIPAQVAGDDIYVPLRSVCDAMGYQVRWIDAKHTAYVSTSVVLPQGTQGVYPVSLPAMGIIGWDYTYRDERSQLTITASAPQELMMVAIDGQRLQLEGQSQVDGAIIYRYNAPEDIDSCNAIALDLGDGNIYSINIQQ